MHCARTTDTTVSLFSGGKELLGRGEERSRQPSRSGLAEHQVPQLKIEP